MLVAWGVQPQTAAAQDNGTLTDEQQADLEYHAANLRNPAQPEANRSRAARYLVRMRLPAADTVLEQALRSGEPELVRAVIDSLEHEPVVPQAIVEELVIPAASADPERIRTIAEIVERVGESGVQTVSAIALDNEGDEADRVGAVRLLGGMRNLDVIRLAVDALVRLITPARNEPEAVTEAAFTGLMNVTGITDFDRDPEAWIGWWDRTRESEPHAWLPDRMERLHQEIARLEQTIESMREQSDAYQRHLDEFMNALYFKLLSESEAAMFTELAAWINDDFAPVRRNAVARADVRVANGQPLTPVIHESLLERVRQDSHSDIRRRAARILDRQNVDGIEEAVGAVLVDDLAPESQRVYLEILERRPVPEAAETIVQRLQVEALRDHAARAINALIAAGELPDEVRASALAAARDAALSSPVIALMASLGEESDIASLTQLLDHESAAIRTAAARALRGHEGAHDAIMQRADDPAVYPVAVALAADQPATPAALQNVISLTPPAPSLQQTWVDAMRRIGEGLAPAELAGADQRLRSIPTDVLAPHELLALRESILARVMSAPPEALSQEERSSLLVGLAQIRMSLGRYEDVLATLDRINGNGSTGTPNQSGPANGVEGQSIRLRLQALLALNRFDEAAAVEGDPGAWIAFLGDQAERDVDAAALLKAEIERRFQDLNDAQRQALERIASRLDDGSDPAGTSPQTTDRPDQERTGQ